ncbi:hypothetical protein ZOD2009_15206 [Haladaptatus paucihalophilus DX253]|uniref:Uncharacterized protein n=1 Tax=Haladaptatus paucihalophilus DX253 TaxID=797209 RepID=E7QW53_HALPU|nr:hypothetical protein ZOD2009_15206 [Haladaptatus paucihalophilus DX253]
MTYTETERCAMTVPPFSTVTTTVCAPLISDETLPNEKLIRSTPLEENDAAWHVAVFVVLLFGARKLVQTWYLPERFPVYTVTLWL